MTEAGAADNEQQWLEGAAGTGLWFAVIDLVPRKYKSRNELYRYIALVKSFPLLCCINVSDE